MRQKSSVFAKYTLACTFEGCPGRKIVEQAQSAGLEVGSIVPVDPTNPAFAKCQLCHRSGMKVIEAPKLPSRPDPPGFTKIPSE